MPISKTMTMEELVRTLPQAVTYLMQAGITCIACGEPVWGTVEEAARQKGFTDEQIDQVVSDLRRLAQDTEGGHGLARDN